MRRFSVFAFLALAACGGLQETFTSGGKTAAQAGNLTLGTEELAKILAAPRGMRVTQDAGDFVAGLWVDLALFAQAAASGRLPTDSASAAAAMWPEIAERRTNRWHDTIVARRAPSNAAAAADSAYAAGQVRVLQHILFSTRADDTPAARSAAKRKAEATLARLKQGADFGQLAAELSDDPGSRNDQGFLPPSPRGAFVPTFDSAGWALEPGGISGVVESPFGYHIIRRPPPAAVQQRLVAYLARQGGQTADAAYMDQLAKANRLEVAKSAPADMKAALERPEASRRSTKRLATFKDGALTVGEYLRWVRALPPPYTMQLRQASDSMLSQFARVLAMNLLLLRQADSAGVRLTEAEWKSVYERYQGFLDSLRMDMGLAGDSAAGEQAVGEKLTAYFDRLIAGQVRLRPMPPALGTVLRERSRYRINEKAVIRAVELAQAERAKADSAGGTGAAQPPAGGRGLQPAPGPAPIPAPAADDSTGR